MEPQPPESEPPRPTEVHRLAPERDAAAATILAACTARGTLSAGAALLSSLRGDPDTSLYGLVAGDDLVAVYALRKTRLSLELTLLVVAEPLRGQGYGRACLADALHRVGRWPLVVEADESTWRFFQTAGFRLVSRHRDADGVTRIRLAWHARPTPAGARDYR